jgi:hypothetical protein
MRESVSKSREKGLHWKDWSSIPLQLLVMGSLWYLGRGLTFDDLEEATYISESSHHFFFHGFTKVMSTKFLIMAAIAGFLVLQHNHA